MSVPSVSGPNSVYISPSSPPSSEIKFELNVDQARNFDSDSKVSFGYITHLKIEDLELARDQSFKPTGLPCAEELERGHSSVVGFIHSLKFTPPSECDIVIEFSTASVDKMREHKDGWGSELHFEIDFCIFESDASYYLAAKPQSVFTGVVQTSSIQFSSFLLDDKLTLHLDLAPNELLIGKSDGSLDPIPVGKSF